MLKSSPLEYSHSLANVCNILIRECSVHGIVNGEPRIFRSRFIYYEADLQSHQEQDFEAKIMIFSKDLLSTYELRADFHKLV